MSRLSIKRWDTNGSVKDLSAKGSVRHTLSSVLIVAFLFAGTFHAMMVVRPSTVNLTGSRSPSLNIKIVFVGFNKSNIDTEYLAWRENLPSQRSYGLKIGEQESRVTYDLRYEFVFPEHSFKQKLLDFLRRTGVEKELENPFFDTETRNVLYDANKVDEWFYKNRAEYGDFPKNGYTFLVANLTELPSVSYDQLALSKNRTISPHYYSVEYVDEDLGYRIRNRQFMTAWGGHHRIWFFDVSAGPSFNAPKELPLQVVLKALKIDLTTQYGRIWLTQYVADYLWEAVLNFAVPQFVYEPIYSTQYRFVINIFDNRTDLEQKSVPISRTVNISRIEFSFKELLPYSEIRVSMKTQNLSGDASLAKVVKESFKMVDLERGYVDVRPVYRFLQLNIEKYVPKILRSEEEVTIPVFCFAFSKEQMAYTSKWEVQTFQVGLRGIALGDVAIVSLTQYYELERGRIVNPSQGSKGIGFTQTVIHECGHMLGLMHPFQFGQIGDFVDSPMGYFTYSYNFSQFDKDSLRRAHADGILLESSVNLAKANELAIGNVAMPWSLIKLSEARNLIGHAEQEYQKMNYADAVRLALESRRLTIEALGELEGMPAIWPLATVFSVAGILLALYLNDIRKKAMKHSPFPAANA